MSEERKGCMTSQVMRDMVGVALSIFSALTITMGAATAQVMERSIPDIELGAFRCLVIMVSTAMYLAISKIPPLVPKTMLLPISIYCILVSIHQVTINTCVTFIPLGSAGCLMRFGSIVTALVLSALLKLEKVSTLKVFCCVLCSIGILMVVQPWDYGRLNGGTAYTKSNRVQQKSANTTKCDLNGLIGCDRNKSFILVQTQNSSLDPLTQNTIHWKYKDMLGMSDTLMGIGIAVGTGCIMGIYYTIQKWKLNDLEASILLFWYSFVGTVVGFILAYFLETVTLPKNPHQIALFLTNIITSTFENVTLYAQTLTSVIMVALGMSTMVVWFYVGEKTVLHDVLPGESNTTEDIGAIITTIAILAVPVWTLVQLRIKKKEEKNPEKINMLKSNSDNEESD